MKWFWWFLMLPFMAIGFVFQLCATGFRVGQMLFTMTDA